MINPLKGLGDLASMQKQARKMQEALRNEEVVVERDGVRIVLSGDQQVKEIEIDGVLENRVSNAINDAVRQTQELAARKLLEITQQG